MNHDSILGVTEEVNHIVTRAFDHVIESFYQGQRQQTDMAGGTVDIYDYLINSMDLAPLVQHLSAWAHGVISSEIEREAAKVELSDEKAQVPVQAPRLRVNIRRNTVPMTGSAPTKLNGYNYFMKMESARLREEGIKMDNTQAHFSQTWSSMSQEEKNTWRDRAVQENIRTGRVDSHRAGGMNAYTMCLGIVGMAKDGLPDGYQWKYTKSSFECGAEAWNAYKAKYPGDHNPLKELVRTFCADRQGKVNFADLTPDEKLTAMQLMCVEGAPLHHNSPFRLQRADEFVLL